MRCVCVNKRQKSANRVESVESMFKCSICGAGMSVLDYKSLACINKHTFDFAKQGYINLVPHLIKTKYNKELFEARRQIAEVGFFTPLTEAMAEILKKYVTNKGMHILDMGCGEGSHLASLCDILGSPVTGFGVDLSKEGVLLAAKNYPDQVWLVADIANSPFQDKQFDVILNILSPSNYAEFERILTEDGLVVKVVPRSGYLQELRALFFDEPEKHIYSNAETIERFAESFQIINRSSLCYSVTLEKPYIPALVQMTPLSWGAVAENINTALQQDSVNITVDLDILVGKRSNI